jgi:hypothetical protein
MTQQQWGHWDDHDIKPALLFLEEVLQYLELSRDILPETQEIDHHQPRPHHPHPPPARLPTSISPLHSLPHFSAANTRSILTRKVNRL